MQVSLSASSGGGKTEGTEAMSAVLCLPAVSATPEREGCVVLGLS